MAANANTPSLTAPPTDPALLPAWCTQVKSLLDFHGLTGAAAPIGGSAGLVLGAWTPISSTSLVGPPQNIVIPASPRYAYIAAYFRHLRSVNGGVELQCRVNAGSGVDAGANYNRELSQAYTGGLANASAASETAMRLTYGNGVSNLPTKGASGKLEFLDPGDATHHKQALLQLSLQITASAVHMCIAGDFEYVGAITALTQIQFSWSDGSNFLDGKCDLFGFGTP